ncbi:MAG TPA: hypothetical protein PKD54_15100 [Pirellulaceae bacterium]|nr:hypothetical protein [Pirellulaceae bacterium]
MGRPKRSEQFVPTEVGIVHVTQRCVRRAFLAGVDEKTGQDFSFRREWIRRRLEALASVFGVDVLAYAIMSNHLHVILRNRPDVVQQWSDEDVAIRWLRVFPGQRLDDHLAEPTEAAVKTLAKDADLLAVIRLRLSDISWFMRALAEPIARLANKQDQCTGRFWEGRFKALKITDEAGLLACAMYVDLNPVRAALVESPSEALHTSAYDRAMAEAGAEIESAAFDLQSVSMDEVSKSRKAVPVTKLKNRRKKKRSKKPRRILRDGWLSPLSLNRRLLSNDPQSHREGVRASDRGFLDLDWDAYWRLLCWTAQEGPCKKVAAVPQSLQSVLGKLGIEATMWRDLVWNFKRYFGRGGGAGSPQSLRKDAERLGKLWHRGQSRVQECFVT